MTRAKLLKDVERYSLNGIGGDLFHGKKGEVFELLDQQAAGLVHSQLAKNTIGAITEEPEDSDDDIFGLTPESKALIRGLKKNGVETILRLYGIEVDKRQSMDAIHKLFIEIVSGGLPDDIKTNEELASFYSTCFGVQLDLVAYEDGDVISMSEAMGAILTEALKGEDS